jgi:ATP-binding cassette subfamily B protein
VDDILNEFRSFLHFLERILRIWGRYSKYLLFLLVSDIIVAFFSLLPPLISQINVDEAILKHNLGLFITLSIFSIVIFVLNAVKADVNTVVNISLDAEIALKLKVAYYKRILNLPAEKIGSYSEGELYTRQTADLAAILNDMASFLLGTLTNLAGLVFVLLITFLYSYKILLMALPFIPLLYFESKIFAHEKSMLTWEAKQTSEGYYNYLKDRLGKITFIKLLLREKKEEERFTGFVKQFVNIEVRDRYLTILSAFLKSRLLQLWSLVFTIYLGYLVVVSEISFGQLTAIMLYFGMITKPAVLLFQSYPLIKILNISCTRAFEIIDSPTEEEFEEENNVLYEKGLSLKGNISAENLGFSYSRDKLLFQNINFAIESGQKVAIVGRNGEGKTTLANLFLKISHYETGSLKIGGREIKAIHFRNLRERIGYLTQDIMLFEGEKYHIKEGKDGINFDFNSGLEKRQLRSLSGGERQKLALLQLLGAGDYDCIIFDEFTNNLDVESIGSFLTFVRREMKGKTLIFITHSGRVLEIVDKILLLKSGKITEYESKQEFDRSDYALEAREEKL